MGKFGYYSIVFLIHFKIQHSVSPVNNSTIQKPAVSATVKKQPKQNEIRKKENIRGYKVTSFLKIVNHFKFEFSSVSKEAGFSPHSFEEVEFEFEFEPITTSSEFPSNANGHDLI